MILKSKFLLIILLTIYVSSLEPAEKLQLTQKELLNSQIEEINTRIKYSDSKNKVLMEIFDQYIVKEEKVDEQIDYQFLNKLAFQIVTGKYEEKLDKMKQQHYVNEFHQRIIKKFETSYEESIQNIQFVYTKKYKTLGDVTGFYMILLQKEKQFELVDIAGHSCATLETQATYTTIAGNPHNDEYYFLGITENGQIDRFDFHIKWLRRKKNQTKTNVPFKNFQCSINQTATYQKLPSEYQENKITTVLPYLTRGIKYTLVGDEQGNIHVWLQNGTYKGTTIYDEGPLVKLVRFYPSVLVATNKYVGFMRPSNLKKTKMVCPSPQEEIVDITTELASNHVFYVLLSNGEILVYDVKSNKKECSSFYLLFVIQ